MKIHRELCNEISKKDDLVIVSFDSSNGHEQHSAFIILNLESAIFL